MSFKVGDVCEVIHIRSKCFGMECVVTAPSEIRTWRHHETREIRTGVAVLVRGEWAPEKARWHIRPEHLRLKRPRHDEFQPAEPEFVSDLLKRLNKVKA